ncbi:MAG TPA: hypothetical protein VFP57_02810 [Sphingomicrobium sp.]|jgi:hypothetical protein|nr:hypothetical protein [Sphingomicrobium sp.]
MMPTASNGAERIGMQLALANGDQAKGWMRLPPAIPPFSTRAHHLFSAVWLIAFLLALAGPIAGFYFRYTSPANNSQLLLGSRAGFAVAPRDATLVRFTVGPGASDAGIRPGDRIIAVYGLPLPKVMPVNEQALAEHADDPAYIAMGNLLFGTDNSDVPLTVRDPDGGVRDVTVATGEQHIDAGARALGISPKLLSFIDLLPVISYPFLLWAAWILHRRNSRDVVSSILSLAVLLTIGAEQPSSVFLANVGVPRGLNVALYDLGNVFLLAGILLFPHGNLTWRIVAALVALPVLMLLHGQLYQAFFVCFMILAVLTLLRCLRQTPSSDMKQQIRWALLGFTGYAILRGISIGSDVFKWSTDSFGQQLLVEMLAGISLALGVLVLQFGLLIALLRYRLYDAEVVISRSANFALITLAVATVFAGVADGLKQIILNYSGNSGSTTPVVLAAAVATVLINPIQERIQRWSENRFQRNLVLLRDDLPECVRDMRETASLDEMLEEVLARIERGIRAVRSAAVVQRQVLKCHDVTEDVVSEWLGTTEGRGFRDDLCDAKDRLFPLRLPLVPSSDDEEPIGFILIGPRPDGSIPSRDEQKALDGVSEAIARAIRTVIKREAREAQVTAMIEANQSRIEQLEALLAGGATGPKGTRRTA